MKSAVKDPARKHTAAEETQSGSLYQKEEQQPLPGHRLLVWLKRRREMRAGRKRESRSFWPTLRLLLIVLAGMAGVLYAALHVSSRAWESKVRAARELEGFVPPANSPGAADQAAGLLQDTRLTPGEAADAGADSASIRRAVFLAEQAREFHERGNDEQAIKLYRESLQVWPHLEDVWHRLGRAYLRERRYEEAQLALLRAQEERPDDPAVLNDLGAAFLLLRRPDRAIEYFRQAVATDESFALSHFNLALCHLSMNDPARARERLAIHLSLQPGNSRALRELAYLDARQGDYEKALERIDAALVAEPGSPQLLMDKAAALALLDRFGESLSFLEKAEAQSSPSQVREGINLPAFDDLRATGEGRVYLDALAERILEARSEVTKAEQPAEKSEPLVSAETPQE